jgi:peroxiredoxin Q/BCP
MRMTKPTKSAARRAAARVRARAHSAEKAHPLEGQRAPAFRLPDAKGETVALSDLTSIGSLVLYFYPKDMTPGCTAEACSFRDNLGRLSAMGARVVGVSGDSPESHRKFADKHGLDFALLSDRGHEVAKQYGVFKQKSLYGRTFMGIERTTFLIDRKGIVRRVFPKVKVAGHAEEVIEALRVLG